MTERQANHPPQLINASIWGTVPCINLVVGGWLIVLLISDGHIYFLSIVSLWLRIFPLIIMDLNFLTGLVSKDANEVEIAWKPFVSPRFSNWISFFLLLYAGEMHGSHTQLKLHVT